MSQSNKSPWQKVADAWPIQKRKSWENFAYTVAGVTGEVIGTAIANAALDAYEDLTRDISVPEPPNPFANAPADADLLITQLTQIGKSYLDAKPEPEAFSVAIVNGYYQRCLSEGIEPLHPEIVRTIASFLPQIFLDAAWTRIPENPQVSLRLQGIDGARARDHARAFISTFKDPEDFFEQLTIAAATFLHQLTIVTPRLARLPLDYDDLDAYITPPQATSTIPLLDALDDPAAVVNAIVIPFYFPTFRDTQIFQHERTQIEKNINAMSGLSYPSPDTHKQVFPEDFKGSRRELIDGYLKDLWFKYVFDIQIPFDLTQYKPHHWAMFARTGHGKTQTLQALILDHLNEPDPPAMIIIDSESNLKAGTGMLATIERLALFDDKLRDHLLVIDPRAETPPALNIFDVDDLDDESETEATDLYAYIFRALDQSLTGLQATAFSFVARLMIQYGKANLTTLLDFLSEDCKTLTDSAFHDAIMRTDPITRRFFETQFYGNRYVRDTRSTIANRLFAVLANRTMQRMFNAPENKVDLFSAMQQKKIVLIAPGGLGNDGTPLFARTMIALALRAAYKRLSLPPQDRHPVLLFIDEAHGLFDEQLDTLLIRARKLGLFLRFATQHFDQIPPDMRAAITANTEVFLAGGLTHNNATILARDMRTSAEFIQDTKAKPNHGTEFACFVQNKLASAIKLSFPFGRLENAPQSDPLTFQARQQAVRTGVAAVKNDHVSFEDTEANVPITDARPAETAGSDPEPAAPPSPYSTDPDDYKDSF